jgi:hypothetical protein
MDPVRRSAAEDSASGIRVAADQTMTPGYLTLDQISDRTLSLDVACTRCERHGRYSLAALVRQHGRDKSVPAWLRDLSADCPRRLDPGASIHDMRGVHCPGLAALFPR